MAHVHVLFAYLKDHTTLVQMRHAEYSVSGNEIRLNIAVSNSHRLAAEIIRDYACQGGALNQQWVRPQQSQVLKGTQNTAKNPSVKKIRLKYKYKRITVSSVGAANGIILYIYSG